MAFGWMGMNKKVSVVLPVYNSVKFLDECLLSLLNQIDANMDIIAIDDCSSDGSYEVLLKYSKRFTSIHVFKNKYNLGSGPTRNIGLSKATGEYVAFIDSDDVVNRVYIRDMVRSANKYKSDIVFSNIKPESKKFTSLFEKYSPVSIALGDLPVDGIGAAWGKLYRNSFIKNNNIRFFNENIIAGEDLPFTSVSYFCAKKISFSISSIYEYRKHNEGCDSVIDERVLGVIKALKHLKNFYEKLDSKGGYSHVIIYLLVSHIGYNYNKLISVDQLNEKLIDSYLTEARKILNFSEEEVISNISILNVYKDAYIEIMGNR